MNENKTTTVEMTAEEQAQFAAFKRDQEKKAAEAKAQAEQLRAEGEAEYMRILSEAYNNSSKAEFYEFVRSLEAAEKSLAQNGNVLILNQDSPLVELFYGK